MDINMDVYLQNKQVLSQAQMQSLNILSMSMVELKEFLQREEIENPLVDYFGEEQESGILIDGKSIGKHDMEISVSYRDFDSFYSGSASDEDVERDLYEGEITDSSIEDMITAQLSWRQMGDKEKKIIDFCIESLDQNGYLTIQKTDIAKMLGVDEELVSQIISELKKLEPHGIFASGLEECLQIQIQGMDKEEQLKKMIKHHLNDVAAGRISAISRALKISSLEVRKLIQVIKGLNPRPLNGYGAERPQYIFPDIILDYHDGQWTIRLNDKWTGSIGINDFYMRMMKEAQDEELKLYFEDKLRRARFVMNAVEQRRKTLEGIAAGIIKRQTGFLLGKEPLRPMAMEEFALELGVHKSTVSRAVREKYILAPIGCLMIRNLFTSAVIIGNGTGEDVNRNTIKERLKTIVSRENKQKPYSDDQIAKLLEEEGMTISRRTVAKYRTEMGIGGAFQRRES